ncbi:MAG: SHOCT domain-containing protein, partial [Actinomycetota bacterium]
MGGRWFYGPGIGFFGGLLWIALFAAFIGLVAWAVYALIRYEHRMAGTVAHFPPMGPYPPGPPGMGPRGQFPPGSPAPHPGWAIPQDDALNAARIRYARGEIDREQYFRVVEDLTGAPRPVASFGGPSSVPRSGPVAGPSAGPSA